MVAAPYQSQRRTYQRHLKTSQACNAATVYTEDASLKQKDCYLIELAEFRRSVLIYSQHRRVRLYVVEQRRFS
jgi:hypothetical protein